MWDLPRPGLEPVSPALAGRFSTTAPPGKPCFFLKLTTDAPGLMEGNFFLSAIGFGLLPPAPKLYSEINLMVLFSTGMFLVGVSGVLSSLGLAISKDKIATPGGHCQPQGRCAVWAVATCPDFLESSQFLVSCSTGQRAHWCLWYMHFPESHATCYVKCDAL